MQKFLYNLIVIRFFIRFCGEFQLKCIIHAVFLIFVYCREGSLYTAIASSPQNHTRLYPGYMTECL